MMILFRLRATSSGFKLLSLASSCNAGSCESSWFLRWSMLRGHFGISWGAYLLIRTMRMMLGKSWFLWSLLRRIRLDRVLRLSFFRLRGNHLMYNRRRWRLSVSMMFNKKWLHSWSWWFLVGSDDKDSVSATRTCRCNLKINIKFDNKRI